jgi:hypothetical protein
MSLIIPRRPIMNSAPASNQTPSQIYGSNLIGWYDGRDPSNTGTPPADNTAIATWVDKQGLNNLSQATGGNQTHYRTSGINGFPALSFNGSTQFIQKVISSLSGNKDCTIGLVCNMTRSTDAAGGLGTVISSGQEFCVIRRQISLFRAFTYAGLATESSISDDSSAHSFVTSYNSSNGYIYTWVDGVLSITDGTIVTLNTNGTFVLRELSGIALMSGFIGEAVLTNSVSTSTQAISLSQYFKNGWSTP